MSHQLCRVLLRFGYFPLSDDLKIPQVDSIHTDKASSEDRMFISYLNLKLSLFTHGQETQLRCVFIKGVRVGSKSLFLSQSHFSLN